MQSSRLKLSQEKKNRLTFVFNFFSRLNTALFSNYFIAPLISIIILAILWVVPFDQWFAFMSLNLSVDFFRNFFISLWGVQAAMLGITFVIIMFLVGTLISKIESVYQEIAGRLIHEFLIFSKIYLILAFSLLSIIYIGLVILISSTTQVYQSLLLFIVNIFLIFYLFYASFTFFKPQALEKLHIKQLKDELSRSINQEIDNRLAQRILLQGKVKYRYATQNNVSYISIKNPITKPKIVKDINIVRLISFSEKIELNVNKNINDILVKDNDILCYVPIGTNSIIIKQIESSFILKKADEETSLDALDGISEQMNEAVKSMRDVKLERILGVYLSLLECFLEQMDIYGIHYDSNVAKSESLFGWRDAFRIERNIEQALELAIKQEALENVQSLIYFPKRVFQLSLKYNDHLLFQKFADLIVFSYYLVSRSINQRIAEIIIDRSWRYFAEIGLECQFLLEKAENEEKASNLIDYISEICILLNKLMKEAIDKNDQSSFKKFSNALGDLSDTTNIDNSVIDLEGKLSLSMIPNEQKDAINAQLKIKNLSKQGQDKIEQIKLTIWFGIGGWITYLFNKGRLGIDAYTSFANEISKKFNQFETLSKTFSDIDINSNFNYGWDFWDSETEADQNEGKLIATSSGLGSNEWMYLYYCLQGIKLSPESNEDISGIAASPSAKIKNDNQIIMRIIAEISADPKWVPILGSKIKEKASTFLLINKKVTEKQNEIEERWIIDQSVSAPKFEAFKETTISNYEKMAIVSKIIKKLGNIENIEPTEEKCNLIQALGFRTYIDKAAFIDGWHVTYFLDAFGRSLARAENQALTNKIVNSAEKEVKCSKESICETLDIIINELNSKGNNPDVIFVNNYSLMDIIQANVNFNSWDRDSEWKALNSRGRYNGFPLVYVHECQKSICIVSINKIGKLIQCKLADIEPFVKISLTPIADSVANELVKKKDNIPKNIDGTEKTHDQALTYFKLLALLEIISKKEFEVLNKDAIANIQIEQ